MHQIDGPRSVPTMPLPREASDPGFFSPGIPEAGQKATVVTYDFMNALMMEIVNPILQAGLTLDKNDNTQLYQAIVQIASDVSGAEIGKVEYFVRRNPSSRYLKCNGLSIGSATSGATSRANADTLPLYRIMWADFENFVLPIQDSEGMATTRGVSADADFAANKRLPLLELRGEHIRVWDDGRGVDSGRSFGSFQADEVKSHSHLDWNFNDSTGVNVENVGNFDGNGGSRARSQIAGASTGGSENRVRTVALSAFIRFK